MLIQLTDLPLVAALFAGACISFLARKLTFSAAITGFVCSLVIYYGTGYSGVCCLAVFFISGTLATAWGRRKKQVLERPGDSAQRKYGQVLANGGSATFFAFLALFFPGCINICSVMLAASLASATSDTLSSELGMLYGKRFYNCLTWKKEPSGLDGVVSLEGTLAGLLGAALIAIVYCIAKQVEETEQSYDYSFLIILFAGLAGNLMDSVFGATLERKQILNNDGVNFITTLIAAGIAGLFYLHIN